MQAHVSVSPERSASNTGFLTLRAAGRHCAIPVAAVIEVLRPLPVEPLAGVPSFLLGLALVRGQPVPVVDLGGVLDQQLRPASRWLHLRLEQRRLALAVEAVGRVEQLAEVDWQPLPCVFDGEATAAVTQLAERDRYLLTQLNVMRLLSEPLWQRIESTQ